MALPGNQELKSRARIKRKYIHPDKKPAYTGFNNSGYSSSSSRSGTISMSMCTVLIN